MRAMKLCAFLFLVLVQASVTHADTIRYRVDVEVTKAFTGIPVGSTGTVTVQYDDTLPDQRTDELYHQYFGLYGYPNVPPVKILWDFGGADAVYTEQAGITVSDAPFSYNADIYAAGTITASPEGVTKGVFQSFVLRSGNAVRLIDVDDVMIGGQALVPPDPSFLTLAETNNGDVGFFGPSAFVAYKATDITVLDSATDTNALFTAGSPASLSQSVNTPGSPFEIAFDVSFDAAASGGGGALQVYLDGVLLSTVIPSAADTVTPTTLPVSHSALLGQDAAELVFQYNGPTGSTMTLDNIVIPGSDLLNGSFDTQSLAAWANGGPGSVAAQVIPVPEPGSLLLLGLLAATAALRMRGPSSDGPVE